MTTPADRLAALAGDTSANKAASAATATPAAPKPAAPFTGIRVIPYSASRHDDAQNFLPWMWEKLKKDNLIDIYFPGLMHNGFVNFCKMMAGDTTQILLVVTEDADGVMGDAVGFATAEIMPLGAATAGMGGFIFFKDYWDARTTTIAAQKIMQHWFLENKFELMLGCVASLNNAANHFLSKMGWKRIGEIAKLQQYHGQECPAVLWQMTKADFLLSEFNTDTAHV